MLGGKDSLVTKMIAPVPGEIDAQQLAARLVEKARAEESTWSGPVGVHVDQNRGVAVTSADREVVDPKH